MKEQINFRKVCAWITVAGYVILVAIGIRETWKDLILGDITELDIILLLAIFNLYLFLAWFVLNMTGVYISDKTNKIISYVFLVGCLLIFATFIVWLL